MNNVSLADKTTLAPILIDDVLTMAFPTLRMLVVLPLITTLVVTFKLAVLATVPPRSAVGTTNVDAPRIPETYALPVVTAPFVVLATVTVTDASLSISVLAASIISKNVSVPYVMGVICSEMTKLHHLIYLILTFLIDRTLSASMLILFLIAAFLLNEISLT